MLRPREWRLGQPRRKSRLKCEFLIPIGVSDPVMASDRVGREGGREMPSSRRMRRVALTQTPLFTSLSKIKSISAHIQKCCSYHFRMDYIVLVRCTFVIDTSALAVQLIPRGLEPF